MPFILRFVQEYRPQDRHAFMALEAQFAAMERRRPEMPQGRRSQPTAGSQATNAIIWECQFPSLQAVHDALKLLACDKEHEGLYQQQAPYMLTAHTEINEVLDL